MDKTETSMLVKTELEEDDGIVLIKRSNTVRIPKREQDFKEIKETKDLKDISLINSDTKLINKLFSPVKNSQKLEEKIVNVTTNSISTKTKSCLSIYGNEEQDDKLTGHFFNNMKNDLKFEIEIVRKELDNFYLDVTYHETPIGPMADIETMSKIIKENLNTPEVKSEISNWRMIMGDGNCFYRAFLFSVIELYILNANIHEFQKIIHDFFFTIDLVNFKTKDEKIDKNEILSIFLLILDYINSDFISKAYDYFIKAYHKYRNFDYGLIKYMRIALFKYIEKNRNSIFSSDSEIDIGNLLPCQFITKNNTYLFEKFYDEFLLSMHNEAEKIIIYLSQIIFNVNLDLFILEKGDKNTTNNLLKQNFPNLNKNSTDTSRNFNTISLFYRHSHYDKFYTKDFMRHVNNINEITFKYHKFNNNLSKIDNKLIPSSRSEEVDTFCDNNSFKDDRIIAEGRFECEKCFRIGEKIIFLHLNNFSICKLCLLEFLNKAFEQRVKNQMSEAQFDNHEYYCRPIVLDTNKNYMLYDEDIVCLLDRTISQHIFYLIERSCVACRNKFEEEGRLIQLNCQCRYCFSCMKLKLEAATDGKIILNKFERRLNNFKPPHCSCGTPQETDFLISIVYDEKMINYFISQAKERLNSIVKDSCMNCQVKVVDQKGKILLTPENSFTKIFKIPVDPETLNDASSEVHILCNGCEEAVRADIIRRYNNVLKGKKKIEKVAVKCAFCMKTHDVEFKFLKAVFKNNLCIIL